MPYGYGAMMMLALVPPLWRRATYPVLKRWDEQLATAGEREILRARGTLLGAAQPSPN